MATDSSIPMEVVDGDTGRAEKESNGPHGGTRILVGLQPQAEIRGQTTTLPAVNGGVGEGRVECTQTNTRHNGGGQSHGSREKRRGVKRFGYIQNQKPEESAARPGMDLSEARSHYYCTNP
eukprot:1188639-Prorocentrum_minimum.AAC.2